MELERSLKSLTETKKSLFRNTTRASLISSKNLRRRTCIRSPSEDKINRIIFDCDSQILIGRHIKEQINRKDKEITQDIGKFTRNIMDSNRFYDENYVANAVKVFRDQKKAFIYTRGRFLGGSLGRKMF